MIAISVDDMRRQFGDYLRQVQAGETIVIMDAETPVAELKPVSSTTAQQRPFGLCAGEFVVPKDFDAPLPESILREFEGR